MDDQTGRGDERQREEHSLPGTNMAGKGPGDACDTREENGQAHETADEEHRPSDSKSDA
jgi:hypothetical protein